MDEAAEAEAEVKAIKAIRVAKQEERLDEAEEQAAIRAMTPAEKKERMSDYEAKAEAAIKAIGAAEQQGRLDKAEEQTAIRGIRAALQRRQEEHLKQGSQYLNTRIQSSSQIVMVLAAGIFMPIAIEHSKNTQQSMHLPTMLCTFLTFFCGLLLRGLVGECMSTIPGPRRYIAIKSLVHACALLLVSLSFSLSLMMRMNVAATSVTLAAAAVFVAQRLWQCAVLNLKDDVDAYWACEEPLQQLLDLSTNVTSTLFGGWFGMAFFYSRNYPELVLDARFVPSEYLTFFTSVAASLMLLKAVRKKAQGPQQLVELMRLLYALVTGVVTTALVIAASKVRGYAVLALVPEAIALAAWYVRREDAMFKLPEYWQDLLNYGGRGREHGEPPAHVLVGAALPLMLGVLTYHVRKDVERAQALSTLCDKAFVLFTAATAIAALGWRLLTQRPMVKNYPVQAAATVLTFSTFSLFGLSVLTFSMSYFFNTTSG